MDCYIVHIDGDIPFVDKVLEDCVHYCLEHGRGVG